MKKIILLFILLIPINVFGISYTEYSDYLYTDTYMENSDLCEVEEIKKYKYYYLERDYSDYFNSLYKSDYYIYRDEDYILSDFITTDIKPVHQVSDLSEQTYTYYQEYQKVKYIILSNFIYEKALNLKEIIIYNKENKKLDYEVYTDNESIKTIINDNDINKGVNLSNNDFIVLELKEEINPKEIYIMYVLAGYYTKTFSFDVVINNSGDINDIYYYHNVNGDLSSLEYYYTYLNQLNYNERLDSEIKKINGTYEDIDNSKIVKYETLYTYKDYLYRYYNYKKIYLDDYYIENNEYIKDENNYITTYKYRCREKLKEEQEPVKIIEVPKEIIKEVEVIKEIKIPVEIIKEVEVPVEVIKEVKVPIKVNNKENKEQIKEIKVIKTIKDKNMTKLVIILIFIILILILIIIRNKIMSKKNKF